MILFGWGRYRPLRGFVEELAAFWNTHPHASNPPADAHVKLIKKVD